MLPLLPLPVNRAPAEAFAFANACLAVRGAGTQHSYKANRCSLRLLHLRQPQEGHQRQQSQVRLKEQHRHPQQLLLSRPPRCSAPVLLRPLRPPPAATYALLQLQQHQEQQQQAEVRRQLWQQQGDQRQWLQQPWQPEAQLQHLPKKQDNCQQRREPPLQHQWVPVRRYRRHEKTGFCWPDVPERVTRWQKFSRSGSRSTAEQWHIPSPFPVAHAVVHRPSLYFPAAGGGRWSFGVSGCLSLTRQQTLVRTKPSSLESGGPGGESYRSSLPFPPLLPFSSASAPLPLACARLILHVLTGSDPFIPSSPVVAASHISSPTSPSSASPLLPSALPLSSSILSPPFPFFPPPFSLVPLSPPSFSSVSVPLTVRRVQVCPACATTAAATPATLSLQRQPLQQAQTHAQGASPFSVSAIVVSCLAGGGSLISAASFPSSCLSLLLCSNRHISAMAPVPLSTSSLPRDANADAAQVNGNSTVVEPAAAAATGKAAPVAEGEAKAVAGSVGKVAAAGGSRTRRDKLLAIENFVAAELWGPGDGRSSPYEVDAPNSCSRLATPHEGQPEQQDGGLQQQLALEEEGKYFCTFPYPYMNGKLHLGHAFTICRAEFQARYQRMQGKRVLWPFGLHCTGMPILACADKLKREFKQRQQQQRKGEEHEQTDGISDDAHTKKRESSVGDSGAVKDTSVSNSGSKGESSSHREGDGGGSGEQQEITKKKSKVAAKTGDAVTQWQIMRSMGIPDEEIPRFREASYWLQYFPPLAMRDLRSLGVAVDWRRSFITTDMNPYYDAFVRWQFNTLLRRNKLKYGMRATIFSRRERQACADHDRSTGEGVVPQEFTLIKLSLQEEKLKQQLQERRLLLQQQQNQQGERDKGEEGDPKREGEQGGDGRGGSDGERRGREKISKQEELLRLAKGREVTLLAATLRPETIYGVTNCFVLPEGEYGVYLAFDIARKTLSTGETTASRTSDNGAASADATAKAAAAAADEEEEFEVAMTRAEALAACTRLFVCSEHAALNMCYQGLMPVEKLQEDDEEGGEAAATLPQPHCLMTISGLDLIGLPLSVPYAPYPTVYVLPMFGIKMNKGTGVVMSVPSDSPDDFAALTDVQKKPAFFKEKYGVLPEWVVPFHLVEIIDIPGLGRRAAARLCEEKKITSQRDTAKLQEAKEEIYRRGFYEGVFVAGPHTGEKVSVAKAAVREQLLQEHHAVRLYEPEALVLSRSGDICVVAFMNQWYLDYGEPSWQAAVARYVSGGCSSATPGANLPHTTATEPAAVPSLSSSSPTCTSPPASSASPPPPSVPSAAARADVGLQTHSQQVTNQFQHVVGWLREWACSRSYGLGSLLPWVRRDAKQPLLIESLSDSTIYMAYYTIAHLLQGGDIYGQRPGPLGIDAADMTDEVFDYIFLQTQQPPQSCSIPVEHLQRLRREFEFWYPLDLRVSGKDLIFNHLVFSLYNHAAIWPDRPDLWPRAFVCNGHVMVDAQKMSKSLGNFLTLEEAVQEFSADAVRIALADAGDSIDDANFQRETANAAVMRLYLLEQFAREVVDAEDLREGPFEQADELFLNEIITCAAEAAEGYSTFQYRQALKSGFYEMHTRRDQYKLLCGARRMHKDLLLLWLKTQVKLLMPVAPHICEHVWSVVLKQPSLVVNAPWPRFDQQQNPVTHREFLFLLTSTEEFRRTKEKAQLLEGSGGKQRGKNTKTAVSPCPSFTHAVIYVARDYSPMQQQVLRVLQQIPLTKAADGTWTAPAGYMELLKADPEISTLGKNEKKEAMAFASFQMKDELKAYGPSALELRLPFDEMKRLQNHDDYIKAALDIAALQFLPADQPHPKDTSSQYKVAKPGRPSVFFYNES